MDKASNEKSSYWRGNKIYGNWDHFLLFDMVELDDEWENMYGLLNGVMEEKAKKILLCLQWKENK